MHLHDTATATPPPPSVLADTGPDGRPAALLLTPATETVLDREGAVALIAELLAVVSGCAGAVAAFAYWAADTAGPAVAALAS
jgi:hypothetical protein